MAAWLARDAANSCRVTVVAGRSSSIQGDWTKDNMKSVDERLQPEVCDLKFPALS
jgi:hypothetical protein